jgi:hypothetical protein
MMTRQVAPCTGARGTLLFHRCVSESERSVSSCDISLSLSLSLSLLLPMLAARRYGLRAPLAVTSSSDRA